MSRKLQPYAPRPEDLAWARNTVSLLRDGGMIGTTTGIYRHDRSNHKITLVNPSTPWDNPVTLLLHFRHHYVFEAIGYTVEPTVDWESLELPDRAIETWESEEIPAEVWQEIKNFFLKGRL